MWDAKGLVQIQVADISTQVTGARQPDHGIHIGSVNIDLPAVLMGNLANLVHNFLKRPMSGRIGNHTSRQMIGVLRRLGAEIIKINIATLIRLYRRHEPAYHFCTGWIGAMSRGWD